MVTRSQTAITVNLPTRLPPSEETVQVAIAEAVEGYRRVFGDRLAQVWLYGSRATEIHRPHSDIDLLAVLHEQAPISEELDLLYSVEKQIRHRHKVDIDGHPTTLEELESSDDDFHYFVRLEGKRVDA